jgi:hypothetical protein
MAHQRKGAQPGKKGGSVIEEPMEVAEQKPKPKKMKKQSKGKHKK